MPHGFSIYVISGAVFVFVTAPKKWLELALIVSAVAFTYPDWLPQIVDHWRDYLNEI